ncbi:MAG: hypothetical protein DBY17_04975 [Oscillospiraceae bacterium]|nr:MAG: hypothetical protein DBY17_04975 [Oscillospiraceae bacterium]
MPFLSFTGFRPALLSPRRYSNGFSGIAGEWKGAPFAAPPYAAPDIFIFYRTARKKANPFCAHPK